MAISEIFNVSFCVGPGTLRMLGGSIAEVNIAAASRVEMVLGGL